MLHYLSVVVTLNSVRTNSVRTNVQICQEHDGSSPASVSSTCTGRTHFLSHQSRSLLSDKSCRWTDTFANRCACCLNDACRAKFCTYGATWNDICPASQEYSHVKTHHPKFKMLLSALSLLSLTVTLRPID